MGKIFKRGETYYIRYDEPIGANGKRKQKMVTCKGMNKKQSEQKLRDILTDLHNGMYTEPSHMLFSEYASQWLDRIHTTKSPSTWDSYRKYMKLHILPALGQTRLDKLRPLQIQILIDSLTKKGLASKTVQNIYGIIHSSLGQAVKLKVLSQNPSDGVTIPEIISPEIEVASLADIGAILSTVDQSSYKIPILIVLATGVRRGEVLALQWKDFNPKLKTLAIRRAFAMAQGKLFVKDTKSSRSRVVMIPQELVDTLQEHRNTQELMGLDTPWICSRIDGSNMSPGGFDDAWRRFRKKINVTVTIKGLRHTQATDLMAANVPVKVISERLGHSKISMTMDTYSHVLPHMQEEAVKAIEAIMAAAKNTIKAED